MQMPVIKISLGIQDWEHQSNYLEEKHLSTNVNI